MSKSFDVFKGGDVGLGHQRSQLTENQDQFVRTFRRFYRRSDRKTFREWLQVVADMLDELD